MTAETLLYTRIHVPLARPDAVARPQRVAQLDDGMRRGRRLTLVCAPPGFGKTTLIREWVAATDRRVAWLTLDVDDNDPGQFMRYLVAALSHADEAMARAFAQGSSPDESPQRRLTALINRVAGDDARWLLVLDDYHALRAFPVHDIVTLLLENLPSNLHVVIGTREDPPLPLARMRARDQVTEVRERDLRFSPAETATFLNHTMMLGLSAESIAALYARTEGWITGLQLAGLAIRQQGSGDRFAATVAGDDRYIVDYLVAEVLDHESEEVREFLRRTSILERLCASLCDALTGRDDSQAMLERLDAANLFLVPLDNRREWYRYHVLFAEVLRLSLRVDERRELHQAAARWYQGRGLAELGVTHTRLLAELEAPSGAARSIPTHLLPEPLSEREIEVLVLIAQGYSNAEIARRLYIAVGTVKRHINNIHGKLQVQSRTQAVARAREIGLL